MIRMFSFALFGIIVLGAFADEGTPPKSSEGDVLSGYLGDWDLAFDADDPFSQGRIRGEWVLDGACLEQIGQLTARFVPNDVKLKVLTTYDAGAGQYKRWVFLSNGRNLMSTGSWDPKTKTMTWVSEDFEPLSKQTIRTKTIETFVDDDTINVSKVSSRAGREVGRSAERRTRRK